MTYSKIISGKRDKWIKDFDKQDWIMACLIVFADLFGLWVCWIL